ncbi:MAG: His-Xaa-Ser system radical SAM maturase HxsB [Candidatus Woesearchaeota archaeon]
MKKIYLPIRYKKINNKYLITGEFFNWIFLTKKQFEEYQTKKIKENSVLYKELVKNRFILDNKEQIELLTERKRNQMDNLFTGPSLHIIVLTKRCNQACIYCHAAAVTEEKQKCDMNQKTAKRTVDIIMSTPNHYVMIEFQGGETLLNFEILKYIVEYANEKNKKIRKQLAFSIVTNLELMDEEKYQWLKKNRVGICTSLDGPKILHDKNRPSIKFKSSYDNTIKWIKRANKDKLRIGALITVSKESLKYPKEIVDEYVKQGYGMLHLRQLHFLGKAAGIWNTIGYTAEEFIDFWKKAMDYIIKLNKKGTFLAERECHIILQKALNNYEPGYLDLMSPCGAIIGQIAYNYDGKIYTCDEARTMGEELFEIGDENSKSIQEIATTEKAIDIISSTINDSYYCDYCTYKTYCGVCPVCNYKETGSPISDVLRTSRCKILMATFDYIFEKLQEPETKKIFESWIKPENREKHNTFD